MIKGMTDFAEAAHEVANEALPIMAKAFTTWAEQIRLWRESQLASLTISAPALGSPTYSGVSDLRTAETAAAQVDAMAAKMGIELAPWQRSLAINSLTGVPTYVYAAKQGGKTPVTRVLDGLRADRVYIDEAVNLP